MAKLTSTDIYGSLLVQGTLNTGTLTTTGTFVAPLGTALLPSYTFSGDLNTGIYSPAADTLAFVEGGVEAMRINSSGFIGIGTTNPLTRLVVSNGLNENFEFTTGNTNAAYNGGIIEYLNRDNASTRPDMNLFMRGQFKIFTGGTGTERLRIDGNGNVGIGTASPGARLDVAGGIIVAGTSTGSNTFTQYKNSTSNIGIIGSDTTIYGGTGTNFGVYVYGNNSLELSTNNSKRLVILGDGNIGIGTATPTERLEVFNTNNPSRIRIQRTGSNLTSNQEIGRLAFDATNDSTTLNHGAIVVSSTPDSNVRSKMDFFARSTAGNLLNGMTLYGTLNNGPYLGIGTATPGYKLSIEDSADVNFYINKTTATWTGYGVGTHSMQIVAPNMGSTSNLAAFEFGKALSANNSAHIDYMHRGDGSTSNYLSFGLFGANEIFNITGATNVGIGTTAPGEKLEVAGNIRYTNAADRTFSIASTAAGTAGRILNLLAGSTTAGTANINGGNLNIRSGQSTGSGTSSIVFQTPNSGTAGATTLNALSDRLVLNSSGASVTGSLSVSGDLLINGSLTTINTSTLTLDDPILTLGGTATPTVDDGKDRGVEFKYFDTAARIGFFGYDRSLDLFTGFRQATNTSEVFSGTLMNARFNNFIASLGAVGTPSFTFDGDPNTGIWSSAADTLNLSTNGAERLRISSTGNVGIGTNNPGDLLHVSGNTTASVPIRITNTNSAGFTYLVMGEAGTGSGLLRNGSTNSSFGGNGSLNVFQLANEPISFVTNNTLRTIITGSGNMGIGTAAPTYRLEVSSGDIKVVNGGNTAGAGGAINFGANPGDFAPMSAIKGILGFAGSPGGSNPQEQGGMSFLTRRNTGNNESIVERMRITDVGRVGIGTTAPGSLLEVGPTTFGANFDNVLTVNSSVGQIARDSIKLTNATATVAGRGVGLSFYSNNATRMAQIFATTTDTADTSKGSLTLDTNFGDIILTPNNGNVGIGTTSTFAKLDVFGNALVRNTDNTSVSFTVGIGTGYNTDRRTRLFIGALNDTSVNNSVPYQHFLDVVGTATGKSLTFNTLNRGGTEIETMRIASNGNVGIGTTSPGEKLHISNDSAGTVAVQLSTTQNTSNQFGRLQWRNTFGTTTYPVSSAAIDSGIGASGAAPFLSFYTSNTTLSGGALAERMRVTNTGNVGIGTTSPAQRLDVAGITLSGSAGSNKIGLGNASDNFSGNFDNISGNIHGDLSLGVNLTIKDDRNLNTTNTHGAITGSAIVFGGNSHPSGVNSISFYTNPSGSATAGTAIASNTAKMFISNAGNVGIGRINPQDLLNIHNSSANANIGFKITRGTQTHGLRLGVNDEHAFLWTTENQNLAFATNNAQRMTIAAAGNVGIGTTSPAQKLEVVGNTKTQDLILSDTSNIAKATMTYDSTSKSVKFVFA
jgi:hypothetical protein